MKEGGGVGWGGRGVESITQTVGVGAEPTVASALAVRRGQREEGSMVPRAYKRCLRMSNYIYKVIYRRTKIK